MSRLFAILLLLSSAAAEAGEVILDAATGEVLAGHDIEAPRFPASVTKLMTIFTALDAVGRGEIGLKDRITVSKTAAAAPPVKLGLRAGETITLEDAIHAALILSSNDAARVIAEAVSGSEADFAARMTRVGRAIGLTATQFRNASGLPDREHVSTALDMARLAWAADLAYGDYLRPLFRKPLLHKGRFLAPRNGTVASPKGSVLGKTGFTCAAGFTAALLVETPEGRRAIATTAHADKGGRARAIGRLSEGWVSARKPQRACGGRKAPRASAPIPVAAPRIDPIDRWALTMGVFENPDAARSALSLSRAAYNVDEFVVAERQAGAGYYALLLAANADEAQSRRSALAKAGIRARVIDRDGVKLLGLAVLR